MKKKKYQIKMYVDGSYLPESKEGYGCMVYEMYHENEVQWSEQTDLYKLGVLNSSTLAEYKALEIALQKIIARVNSEALGLKKCSLELFTDLQAMSRQLQKVVLPPKKDKMLEAYKRIEGLLKKIKGFEVFWVERSENKAGHGLESFISYKKHGYSISHFQRHLEENQSPQSAGVETTIEARPVKPVPVDLISESEDLPLKSGLANSLKQVLKKIKVRSDKPATREPDRQREKLRARRNKKAIDNILNRLVRSIEETEKLESRTEFLEPEQKEKLLQSSQRLLDVIKKFKPGPGAPEKET